MRGLGAELVLHGRDYDEARERCERLAHERGYRYVHSGNEPLLIAGVATETLAILEEQPRIEVIIVPVGGGSGAAGACIVASAPCRRRWSRPSRVLLRNRRTRKARNLGKQRCP